MRIMTGAFMAVAALGLVMQSAAGGAAQAASAPLAQAGAAWRVSIVADATGGPEPSGQIASRGLDAGGTWGKAQRVPGTGRGQSEVLSVSCASPGNCGAGGFLTQRGEQAMVVSQKKGAWGKAEVVPGTVPLNTGGQAWISSVSCVSPGNCSAGGSYTTPELLYAKPQQAFVVSEHNGIWGKAEEVPGLGALNTGGVAVISSVSCGAKGSCVAGGWYAFGSEAGGSAVMPFVVSQEKGRWGKAEQPPGLVGAVGEVFSVSCGAKGSCVAGGYFVSHVRPFSSAFVAVQRHGRWVRALPVRIIDEISTVSCASAGNCTAVGRGFAVSQHHGRWGKAEEIPGLPEAFLESLSCAAPGECSVGGVGGFVAVQHKGVWGKAELVPGMAALDHGNFSYIMSVSCGAAGNCSAGGSYHSRGGGPLLAFVVSQDNGVWGKAEPVPGLAALSKRGPAGQITSVSCASAGNCSAGGYSTGDAFTSHAFVVSQVTRRPARPSRP